MLTGPETPIQTNLTVPASSKTFEFQPHIHSLSPIFSKTSVNMYIDTIKLTVMSHLEELLKLSSIDLHCLVRYVCLNI